MGIIASTKGGTLEEEETDPQATPPPFSNSACVLHVVEANEHSAHFKYIILPLQLL